MTGRDRDELSQRYLEASAQDMRRPAASVRAAVRAHAQIQLAQGANATLDQSIAPSTARAPAANQSRWKISLLASIALAGLTGLLVLQFERGTPDEKEVALGQKSASESAAPSPSHSPAHSPSPSSTAIPELPSAPVPPLAAPEAMPQSGQPPTAATSSPPVAPKESRQLKPSPAPQPSASMAPLPSPNPSPSPFPASPQAPSPSTAERPAALADAPPAATSRAPNPTAETVREDEAATGRTREASPRAASPPPALAPAPAPAARAQAPNQKPNGFNADAARSREETGSAGGRADSSAPNVLNKQEAASNAKAALQQAARNGSIAQLERLLARGMPLQSVLNAPDGAGRTPLVLAVINGHAAMVQRLLALGANPALVDQGGMDALQHARQRGRGDIAALIEAAP